MAVMKYITKNPRAKTTPRPAVHQPVPLVAGTWGVRCLPGPAWENAPQGATWGTVLNPSTVVHDWCAGTAGDDYVGGLCADLPPGAGTHRLGGWFPSRSAAVAWDGFEGVWFHKCGDDGQYDLKWYVPKNFVFDRTAYLDLEMEYNNHLRTLYPDAVQHVVACERVKMCSGLRQLLRGDNINDVERAI
jgi:hypothetical protein